jgi:hypothetical protein
MVLVIVIHTGRLKIQADHGKKNTRANPKLWISVFKPLKSGHLLKCSWRVGRKGDWNG